MITVSHSSTSEWFSCSCCPTNYCRFLPQLGSFICSENDDETRLNIPAAAQLPNGIEVSSGYPYDGDIRVRFANGGKYKFSVRIPGWCGRYTLTLNDTECPEQAVGGYVTFNREWRSGDEIRLILEMPVRVLYPNCKITSDAGRIALTRGPLVYALESVDNGKVLPQLIIPAEQEFALSKAAGLPEGTVAISGRALQEENSSDSLYSTTPPACHECTFTAIPYALWQNRGESNMAVWLRACR